MKKIATLLAIATTGLTLSACSAFSGQTYCLEEREANGLDYMIVADNSVCDNPNSDSEYYSTSESLNFGDIAYVEADGSHSVKHKRRHEEIKKITTPPPYKPPTASPKICLKGYAPPPPAPKPPAPRTVQPAPAPIKPAPVQTPPKAPVVAPAPTIKPGC